LVRSNWKRESSRDQDAAKQQRREAALVARKAADQK
jgi:hypothetical protein